MKKNFNNNITFDFILSKYVSCSYMYKKNKWKKIIHLSVLLYAFICGIYAIFKITNLIIIPFIFELIGVVIFSILFIILSVIYSNLENASKDNLISDYYINKDNIQIIYQYVLSELNNNEKKTFVNELIQLFKNIFIFFIGYSFDGIFNKNMGLSINGSVTITLFMFFILAIINISIELVKLFINKSNYKYYFFAKEIENYKLHKCNDKKSLFKLISNFFF